MSKLLRLLVVTAALLLSLAGASSALAAAAPATGAGHVVTTVSNPRLTADAPGRASLSSSTQIVPGANQSAAGVLTQKTAAAPRSPHAVFFCNYVFPSAYEFDYVCTVYSGTLQFIAHCSDGSVVPSPVMGPGTWPGRLYCPSGLPYVTYQTTG